MSSAKSSKNILKKPDRTASNNQFSSLTPNKLVMKAKKAFCISNINEAVIGKTIYMNPNELSG